MNRMSHVNVAWPPRHEVAQIVKCPIRLPVPIGTVPTARATPTTIITTLLNYLWLRQIINTRRAFSAIRHVPTWTQHGVALLDNAPLLSIRPGNLRQTAVRVTIKTRVSCYSLKK